MAETKPTVGVLQTFVGVVGDAAEWLVGLLGDDTARRAVFSDLGMEPKEGIEVNSDDLLEQMSGDLTSVRSYAAANVDQADAAALVSTVEAIVNIVEILADQVEQFSAETPGDRQAVEAVTALLQVYAVDAVRDTLPGLYAFARAATLVTDEALGVDWDRVGEVLGDFFGAFLLETESDARRASPWLGLVATFVKLVIDKATRDPEAPAPAEDDEDETFHAVYGWDPDPTLPPELQPAEQIAERTLTMMVGDRLGDQARVALAFVPTEHGGPGLLVNLGGKAVFGSVDQDGRRPEPGRPPRRRRRRRGVCVPAVPQLDREVRPVRSRRPDPVRRGRRAAHQADHRLARRVAARGRPGGHRLRRARRPLHPQGRRS